MASKRAAIGDLIKSDMSRRTIGEEFPIAEAAGPVDGFMEADAGAVEYPLIKQGAGKKAPVKKNPQEKEGRTGIPAGSAGLLDYITAEIEPEGFMDEQDRRNFYDFLLNQTMRYLRGFKAGKRFHQS